MASAATCTCPIAIYDDKGLHSDVTTADQDKTTDPKRDTMRDTKPIHKGCGLPVVLTVCDKCARCDEPMTPTTVTNHCRACLSEINSRS